ncbi:uracil-DNA glycosylase [Anaerosolibacter sp.]|uniref:uracil-DNA glycosylase n=1 Tax=Anaerosolibacter sp. TaxID=1872527 RepID=UPI0039EF7FF4
MKRVHCASCKFYYVTWDTNFPYGCKLYKIKSKQLPSILVIQSTGKKCDQYISKNDGLQ